MESGEPEDERSNQLIMALRQGVAYNNEGVVREAFATLQEMGAEMEPATTQMITQWLAATSDGLPPQRLQATHVQVAPGIPPNEAFPVRQSMPKSGMQQPGLLHGFGNGCAGSRGSSLYGRGCQ